MANGHRHRLIGALREHKEAELYARREQTKRIAAGPLGRITSTKGLLGTLVTIGAITEDEAPQWTPEEGDPLSWTPNWPRERPNRLPCRRRINVAMLKETLVSGSLSEDDYYREFWSRKSVWDSESLSAPILKAGSTFQGDPGCPLNCWTAVSEHFPKKKRKGGRRQKRLPSLFWIPQKWAAVQ